MLPEVAFNSSQMSSRAARSPSTDISPFSHSALPASSRAVGALNHLLTPPSPRPIKAAAVLEQGQLTRATPLQFICAGRAYLRCSL